MRRLAIHFVTALLIALALAPATPAMAQNDPVTGFFRFMFGQPRQPQRIEAPPAEAPKKASKPAEPKIVETPKNPNAQVVLVVGDVLAQGVGTGLQMAFAEDPTLLVVAKTRGGAALTRDGDADWGKQAQKIFAETKADFIVTTIGVNDWLPIAQPGAKSAEPGTEEWNRLYAERLDRWIAQLKATGRPFWWVGLPPTADSELGPTKRAAFAAFLASLNDLAKPRVEAAGGTFVDIWTAFTDEDGHFAASGPDIDGKLKRLRASDGILFTRAGQRKIAYFIEPDIRQLARGEPLVPPEPKDEKVVTPTQPTQPALPGALPQLPPAPWATVGPVMPLDGATVGGDTTLAGGSPSKPAATVLPGGYPVGATPAHRRLVEGQPIDAPAGRVDAISRRTP